MSVLGEVLGPIRTRRGVEQGGIPSVQLYQLVTDLDLVVLNSRGAGDPVGPMYLASLGQTDDQAFFSLSPSLCQWLRS